MVGCSVNPMGGICDAPVANIGISANVTHISFSFPSSITVVHPLESVK